MADSKVVNGVDELRAKLADIPRAMRVKMLKNALTEGIKIVRDTAKRNAPVLTVAGARHAPYRKRGTIRNAIRVRTSRRDRLEGNVGVFVNVKPLPRGEQSARNPKDPFYWRWQEFGWTPARGNMGNAGKRARRKLSKSGAPRSHGGIGFLQKGADRLWDALPPFERVVSKWLSKIDVDGKVTP